MVSEFVSMLCVPKTPLFGRHNPSSDANSVSLAMTLSFNYPRWLFGCEIWFGPFAHLDRFDVLCFVSLHFSNNRAPLFETIPTF